MLVRYSQFAVLVALALLAQVTAAKAATVSFIGIDLNGPDWRDTAVAKPFDLDGNNVFGSAGYYLIATKPSGTGGEYGAAVGTDVISAPSFTSPASFATLANRATGYPYGNVNDPSVPHSGSLTPVISPGTVTDGTADKATFTIAAAGAVPASFTVAIMVDNLDDIGFNASALTIHNAANTATLTVPELAGNQRADFYVFRIDGAVNGEQFFIGATQGVNNAATFAALAFDVVPVPEPSSVALFGMGFAALVYGLRRRGA